MHVCFVCSGNICRSPVAAVVLSEYLRKQGLSDRVKVTSAGTGPWHVGQPMDRRSAKVLAKHGYPTEHIARQVDSELLAADLLIALDSEHLRELKGLVSPDGSGRIKMLRSFDPGARDLDVPDPYFGGAAGFDEVLEMVEASMPGLVEWIRSRLDG